MSGWIDGFKAVGAIVGALATVLAFTRTYWVPVWRARKAQRQASRELPQLMAQHIAKFETFCAEVTHEIRPNNGSSLKDALARIERNVQLLQGVIRHRADGDGGHGVVECDAAGLAEWANATLLRWTAMQAPLLLGWGWVNTIAHVDRARVRDEWEDALAEARDFTTGCGLITPDGVLPVEIRGAPLRDSRGNVLKWLWTVTLLAPVDRRQPGSGATARP